ncbi:Thioredoxin-like fold protein [Metarhizium album ARSEF 1941]|uniref:Thioredoxin-like fold protein n=1 Tax=Metarhizium album (strain ARSEF 1941) TaxID=1081103 RepID=A0A0B2WVS7_METAS|nr:Thioredoxin-like fold protein [Metarhizium album ARSEF 1941]KHN98163.1 Thioredoxin-like fold protein [Metarhizium album ARSEF 1941]
MRSSILSFLAGALALVTANASGDSGEEKDTAAKSTTFNGQDVPSLEEFTAASWPNELTQSKWLVVKFFSPWCGHCQAFAPTYQTVYEYYFTLEPRDGSNFLKKNNMRFGMVDCTVYGDLCSELKVNSYPTTILFKNGVEFDRVKGAKGIDFVSKLVEKALEEEHPGSRPQDVKLPSPGATEFPTPSATATKDDANKNKDAEKNEDSRDGGSKKTEVDDKKPFGNDWSVPTAGELEKAKKPPKPTVTPNPEGVSIPLTAESFQNLVTQTQDAWFIKFYAPWCSHCKAMGPTWEQVAKTMRGTLNIGEVNCDKESRLCKDVHATAYPTIMFFKGGEKAEYSGLRGLGDFLQFAEKAVDLASGIPDVNATSFKAMEETEDVIFVYFYDHATTSEDFRALEQIPLSLIGRAKLVKTNDPEMYQRFKITTWPRLMVSREGRPSYYPPITPNEMRDKNEVLNWMRHVWLPLVPELNPSNARQILNGKIVVLGILSHSDKESFSVSLREMKSAANEWLDRQIQEFQLERKKLRDSKQMRIEEAEDRGDQRALRAAKGIRVDMNDSGRKEVTFAWVDGAYWQRWVRQTYGIDVKDGERVIINDEDNRRYWDQTATGNYIMVSRTSIMETLDKIVYGPHVIKHKLTVSTIEKIFFDIQMAFVEHLYLSMACVLGITFGTLSWLRGRSRRARAGHFRLDDAMGINQLKEGLLGMNGNSNQKTD